MPGQGLPRYVKMGYGVADLGINVFVVVKQILLLYFLTDVLAVPVGLAALITGSVLVLDIFTDPLMGWISDRTPSAVWRRRIYLPIGALLLASAVYLTFSPPLGWSRNAQAFWVWGFFALASLGFTAVVIPYSAMVAELTRDPIQRSQLLAWRMASAAFGLLLAGALWPILASPEGQASSRAALIFAPLILLPILIAFWVTRGFHSPSSTAIAFSAQIRAALKSRAFVMITLLYGVQTLATALLAAGIPYAARQLFTKADAVLLRPLVEPLGVQASIFAFFILGAMVSQPLWATLSGRYGKLWTYRLSTLYYGVTLLLLVPVLWGSSLDLLCFFVLLLGIGNGAYQQVPWSLAADISAETAAKEAVKLEGSFAGFWLLGQKIANAIGPMLFGLLLALAGYSAELVEAGLLQSAEVKQTIRLAMSLLPALLFLASLGLIGQLARRLAP